MKELKLKSFFAIYLLVLFFVNMPVFTMAQQVVHSPVVSHIKQIGLNPVARLDSTQQLTLEIGFPLQNRDALDNILQELYDPSSPKFHQWLTPEQFTSQFSPSQVDYQAVINYAKANGFSVLQTYSDRKMIKISGPVKNIEEAFHLKMMVYNRGKGTFYAPDADPVLDLTIPVAQICGLQNNVELVSFNKKISDNNNKNITSVNSYTSADFRSAYNLGDTLTGAGQTVGIISHSGFTASYISTYEHNTGLDTRYPSLPKIDTILIDNSDGLVHDQSEVCLDIEMAIAMAPGLSKVVVYEFPNDPAHNEMYFDDVLQRMTQNASIKQFSFSSGFDKGFEYTDVTADGYFLQMETQGQSFFQASGDQDAITNSTYQFSYNGTPQTFSSYFNFPLVDPYITLVGGTNLTISSGSYGSESIWNTKSLLPLAGWRTGGSTGGVSSLYSIPQWQLYANTSNSQVSTSMRNSPDVSMVANNIYEYENGDINGVSGTSASAPLWAGFAALANEYAAINGRSSIGFINPVIYSIGRGAIYGSAFNDVTSGDNMWELNNVTPPTHSDPYFSATTGYDLCAGWGSPRGQTLINLLSAIVWSGTKTISSSYTVPAGQALIILPGTTLTISNGASLIINGVMNAVGTPSSPITFNLSGTAGITISSTTSNNSTLSYVTINNGAGITFSTGTTAVIQNSSINNCTQGVYIYNSSPQILNNQIIDPQQNGIYLDASGYSPTIQSNTIKKNTTNSTFHQYQGVYIISNSTPSISNNKIGGFAYGIYSGGGSTTYCSNPVNNQNNLIVNNMQGMTSAWGSTIYAGYTGRGMYNSVHDNIDYDLNSYNSSFLYSGFIYLGTSPKLTHDGTSTLYDTPIISDPWNGQTPSIEQLKNSDKRKIVESQTIPNPIISDSSSTDPFSELNLEDKGDIFGAETQCMGLIAKDNFADFAITELFKLFKLYSRPDILNYFGSFSSTNKHYPLVSKLLADNNLQSGQFDKAISIYDNLIKSYPNDYYGIHARFQKLFAYVNIKNDKTLAQQMLTQINALNLTDPLWTGQIKQAENLLGSTNNNSANYMTNISSGYAVMNYPNPFNPSTIISYQLPKDGLVILKVFDVLGREVSTLVNDYRTPGAYTVSFDASKLASGIYFYQLRAGSFIATKKMLLVK